MKISIVVPVFNAGKVLKRTIDSILNQGLNRTEYEIILVDDGSSDNSNIICCSYEKAYPRLVRVLTKQNEGVAIARNAGMALAKGDYVYFMDADDYLMPNGFRYLIDNFLDVDLDVLVFYSSTIKDFNINHKPEGNIAGQIIFDGFGSEYLQSHWQTFIWTQLFRRSFLDANGITFQNLTISEDVLFNLQLWSENPRVRIVSSKIYRYINYDSHHQLTKRRDSKHLRACIDSQMTLFAFVSHLNHRFKREFGSNNMEIMFQSLLRSFMSRVLSSDLSREEFQSITKKLHELDLLPMKSIQSRNARIMDLLIRNSCFFPIYKFLYQSIFIPFILHRISRE